MFNQIKKAWRVFRTGVAFSLFGIGALCLTFFIFPPIIYLVKSEERKKVLIRRVISASFRFFMYWLHFTGLINFKTKRLEVLKNESSSLLIANHPTLIDVVAIIAFLPNACCIVKKELWNNRFLRGVVQSARYIPNIHKDDFIDHCREAVDSGDVLIIFPEGTRTKPGEKIIFQRGTAHIALILNCPVRCVEIHCNPIFLTKGRPWYRVPERRADFTLSIKERLVPGDYIESSLPRPKAARVLTRLFMEQYCRVVSSMLV